MTLHTEIAELAQKLYEERLAAGVEGDAESDWLEAEKQILTNKKPEAPSVESTI